ncbi:MAG: hypothetical protein JSS56_28865, partial [Proteobacteria bacterium]|nr:hypothetical protein [Pseudomonadota bacterium]
MSSDNESVASRPRTREPLPSPSDWTFELIEQYHGEIARVARSYKLDT